MPKKKKYTIRFRNVPLNGRAGKADLYLMDKERNEEVTSAAINPQDPFERLKLGRYWEKEGYGKAEDLARAIDKGWCEKVKEVRENGEHEAEPHDERRTQAQVLLELANGAEYFHTLDSVAFVSVPIGDDHACDTFPVRSQIYRSWLAGQYYAITGKAPGSQTMQDVVGVLEAKARYDGPTLPVHVRIAEHQGAVYIDLGGDSRHAIEATVNGWRVVHTYPVKFRRAKGLKPWPIPQPGGNVTDLRPFVNVTEEDWVLILAWELATLWPRGPYPVLFLSGEQGSAKTTTGRILKRLIDPNVAEIRPARRDERDLIIAGNNSWIVALDNLSSIKNWLSDALCRMSTGGGFGTRKLYEDDDETLFDVQRPVLATGIDQLPTRTDLLDRGVMAECQVIEDEDRKPESQLYDEFEEKRPIILGAFLDLLCGALRELPKVQIKGLPRMADFALLAVAGMRALGLQDSDFLEPYLENQARAFGLSLDRCPIVEPLYDLLAKYPDGAWDGTVLDLFKALGCQEDPKKSLLEGKEASSLKKKGWPKSPEGLSNLLRRIAPALRKQSRPERPKIDVTWLEKTMKGRQIHLKIMKEAQGGV